MFRVQQGPPTPPPINTRFAIINTIYNNPFHCAVAAALRIIHVRVEFEPLPRKKRGALKML
ncbi:hypothetical protein NECAME_16844 [Necator americanus]|uniref:Uncharacterized protein n=1 Tax=Necator americanus TaxID=51031 RepID=W2TW04_NECAM|nr:hypothetical protein NECAME_16844 [Necator americanus]ETN85241.1 hypothetical protein NECAME_16844 [Necator americanus]